MGSSKPLLPAKSTRKPLVPNTGPIATILIMSFSHFCVTLLCLNVLFDLFILGIPGYALSIFSPKLFRRYMTSLINWTTPIVFAAPMLWSGTGVYIDDPWLLAKAKSDNSLLLANHGSRIDWMIGMYVAYIRDLGTSAATSTTTTPTTTTPTTITGTRQRVGFVCEGIIQYMPLIGWYRRLVCEDVFVMRSFKQDASTITSNCNSFHNTDCKRMLFLSPEGVVCDFGERDKKYIAECRDFARELGYSPFEYVLTPRYKGLTCLVEQVKHGGAIVSVLMLFERNGVLLNCELTSLAREIPDIYMLLQGIGSSLTGVGPVNVYVNMKELHFTKEDDIKKIMMDDYVRKDEQMRDWARLLAKNGADKFKEQFYAAKANSLEVNMVQFAHTAIMVMMACYLDRLSQLLNFSTTLFLIVSFAHTLGWFMNSTSMESVPFETGIKAVVMFLFGSKHKEREAKAANEKRFEEEGKKKK
jgi:1-acyl-sn-glycerol-3-phosphate acyltransferase